MKLATFSFDDGGPADFAVADLFRSHDLVPTFYIPSALLNMDEMIYGMPSKDIRPKYDGMEIGAHTVSHPHLSLQSPAHTRYELEVSRDVIHRVLGVQTELFAHPYGSESSHTTEALTRAGYKWARRVWRPWQMRTNSRFGMPISCMFTSEYELGILDEEIVAGHNLHILGHSWMIQRDGQLSELDAWIRRLLSQDYTILPNSIYFERTFQV